MPSVETATTQPDITTPTAGYEYPALPERGPFDPSGADGIELANYPIVPVVDPAMRAVYQAGLAQGNDPHVFSKLGDSMTENPYFLIPFAEGKYDLGEYAELQEVIGNFAGYPAREGDWQSDSFGTQSLAAGRGFTVAGPLDITWADPDWCKGGETPLACEYRVAHPSIAIIMFGTNDSLHTEPEAYNYYLRTLVVETLSYNIVPLLSTFPTRPEAPDQSRLFNKIVIQIATDYRIPLVNLNLALKDLPNGGVDLADTLHLTTPSDKRPDVFSAENLQAGFTVRNLVTLQALDAVWRTVR